MRQVSDSPADANTNKLGVTATAPVLWPFLLSKWELTFFRKQEAFS